MGEAASGKSAESAKKADSTTLAKAKETVMKSVQPSNSMKVVTLGLWSQAVATARKRVKDPKEATRLANRLYKKMRKEAAAGKGAKSAKKAESSKSVKAKETAKSGAKASNSMKFIMKASMKTVRESMKAKK